MLRFIPVFLIFTGTQLLSCKPDSGGHDRSGNQEKVNGQEAVEEMKNGQEPDYAFLADAYQYNSQLIRLNELAADKAGTLTLRDFARQSVQYHLNLQKETEQIAKKYSINLPSEPEDQAQQLKEELSGKEGTKFDMAYLKAIKELENKMLKEYEEGSASAPGQAIRNQAEKTISNLKAHQLAIKELLEETKEK